MKHLLLIFIPAFVFISSCDFKTSDSQSFTIAFGSCNKEDQPQPMWKEILNHNPDLWVWLGDNIYGDSQDPQVLQKKYQTQLENLSYKKFIDVTPVIGTWDDHDYGVNDGGLGNPIKKESQQAFCDFMMMSLDNPVRNRKGVYSSNTFKFNEKLIKVILLDSRYHRDTIYRVDGIYQPNFEGSILGEEQWKWLENELTDSKADVHIIGNGIQFLSAQHRFEKWANFPNERKRLLELLINKKPKGLIMISGDRHIGEVSKLELEGLEYPVIDVTSSGLTHSYEEASGELNELRISPLIGEKNYGIFKITIHNERTIIEASLNGIDSKTFYKKRFYY